MCVVQWPSHGGTACLVRRTRVDSGVETNELSIRASLWLEKGLVYFCSASLFLLPPLSLSLSRPLARSLFAVRLPQRAAAAALSVGTTSLNTHTHKRRLWHLKAAGDDPVRVAACVRRLTRATKCEERVGGGGNQIKLSSMLMLFSCHFVPLYLSFFFFF